MIDMHCHIVPYTDDGARDVQTAIDMGRKASSVGYKSILATSHYILHDNELVNKEFLNNVEKLNELYQMENIDLTVYPANEVFFTNDILKLIEDKKVSTLANSRYVLVELPLFNKIIPMNVYDEFNALQDAGYVPILAHPERYEFVSENIEQLNQLIESGVLLQSNIASITGKYGRQVKKNLKKMLKYDMVHFLGTDSHTTSVYDNYEKCMKKIRKIVKNEERMNQIMYENPNKVIVNEEIKIWYPKNK